MTNVSQEARTFAADLLDELSGLLDHNGIGQVADLIRDGEFDEHVVMPAVMAFQRQIEAATVERCAAIAKCAFDDRPNSRSGHHSEMDWTDGYRDGTHAAEAAIRAEVKP